VSGPTVEFKVHFRTGAHGRKRVRTGARPAPPEVKPGRVPRVARVMAMAIRFDRLVREGHVRDYAELARLSGVTRARISQIMTLLDLAPDLQEQILHLRRTATGRDPITERVLRDIAAEPEWGRQRQRWRKVQPLM
jgi:hypothetical protein